MLTAAADPGSVLPALTLLGHRLTGAAPSRSGLRQFGPHEAVLVDARTDLVAARALCRLLSASIRSVAPVIAVLTEGDLVGVSGEWMIDEFLLAGTDPAEIQARLRLLTTRPRGPTPPVTAVVLGELVIDEESYSVRLAGRALTLAYREFALLAHLARHPGQVFTRSQLLADVWGYDFFGGTRTVDVHVRRLRAKLGPDHSHMIDTVRNVGYRCARPRSAHPTTPTDSATLHGADRSR